MYRTRGIARQVWAPGKSNWSLKTATKPTSNVPSVRRSYISARSNFNSAIATSYNGRILQTTSICILANKPALRFAHPLRYPQLQARYFLFKKNKGETAANSEQEENLDGQERVGPTREELLLPEASAPPRPPVPNVLDNLDPNSPEYKYITQLDINVEPGRLIQGNESPQLLEVRMRQEVLYRSRQLARASPLFFITRAILGTKYQERALAASALYWLCRDQAERPEWNSFGLPSTFYIWFHKCLLHIWMVINRVNAMSDAAAKKRIIQMIIDLYFDDIEDGIIKVGNTANPFIISKNKKYFLKFYHGTVIGYDDGFWRGDAYLADALFRNFFGMDPKCSAVKLEKLVAYVRREMAKLDKMSDEELLKGKIRWGAPPSPPPPPSARFRANVK